MKTTTPQVTKPTQTPKKRSWSKTFKPTPDEMKLANSLLQYEDDSMKVRSALEGYRKATDEEKATIQQIIQENKPANIKKMFTMLAAA